MEVTAMTDVNGAAVPGDLGRLFPQRAGPGDVDGVAALCEPDGSLPQGAFAFYVVQDAQYLRRYAEALAAVASRAPDTAGTEMFPRHAAGVAVEAKLHDSLLADLGIDPESAGATEAAPTTLAYTSYLLATVRGGSYAEGVGAVLPCYRIYWEVGKELLRRGSPDARYQRWIDTYGGEEFGDIAREVLAATHHTSNPARPRRQADPRDRHPLPPVCYVPRCRRGRSRRYARGRISGLLGPLPGRLRWPGRGSRPFVPRSARASARS
jgi:thiaminase (transcriptional activator TenA)